jgi:transcriptional regulator with XRE-family HTH domain
MQDQQFFTREMDAQRRKIRLAATLTQAELADRMGLKGKWRDLEVRRLELGRIGDMSSVQGRAINHQDTREPSGRQTYQISNRAYQISNRSLLERPERFFASLRMTGSEGLRMTEAKRVAAPPLARAE